MQGLPHLLPLLSDSGQPIYSYHDLMASSGVVMTPHGDGVMMTPVNNVMYTPRQQFSLQKERQQPKHHAGDLFRQASDPGLRNRRPSQMSSESLLHDLLQRHLRLKQQQQEQQRQHLEQQKQKQQQLEQHQQHQRQLLQLLLEFHKQKQQAQLRGVDPQTIRAIVREELEKHRRQYGSDLTVNNIRHIIASLAEIRGADTVAAPSLPDILTLSRSPGSRVRLHRHQNGSISVHVSFPSVQRLGEAISRAAKAQQDSNPASAAPGTSAAVSPAGGGGGRGGGGGGGPVFSANAVLSNQRTSLVLQQLQIRRRQEQQRQLQLQQQQHQRQQQQQQQLQQPNRRQLRDEERSSNSPPSPAASLTSSSTSSTSQPSSSAPPTPSSSSSDSAPKTPPTVPSTEDKRNNEVNRALYQIDVVLPLRLPHKEVPIQFNKARDSRHGSSSSVRNHTDKAGKK